MKKSLLNLHQQDVETIRSNLLRKNFSQGGTKASNTMRNQNYRHLGKELGVGKLDRIVEIDEEKQVVLVEPGVPMDRLAKTLLAQGYLIPVVPEFKGITVGGAISGAALESSAHRHGQFNDTCSAYEILLGNGEVVRATEKEYADLFHGVAGAYGSLGIVTLAEIKLVRAKPWVRLSIHRPSTVEEALRLIGQSSADFIEGIVFSKDHIAVVEGHLVSEVKEVETLHLGRLRPFYYQQIKNTKHTSVKIPIFDYLFRHDRGAFWIGSYGQHYPLFLRYYLNRLGLERYWPLDYTQYKTLPDQSFLFSLLMGSWMTSRRLYRMVHRNAEEWIAKRFIVQDYYIPIERTAEFIETVEQETGVFPLWLCPVKPTRAPQIFSPHSGKDSLLIDVGVYGLAEKANRKLEEKTAAFGGRKMLYSHNNYLPEEFWAVYDRPAYEALRSKYHAGVWTDITKKVLNPHLLEPAAVESACKDAT